MVGSGMIWPSGAPRHRGGLHGVRAVEANTMGAAISTRPSAVRMPFGDLVAANDAPEDVDENRRTFGSVLMTSRAFAMSRRWRPRRCRGSSPPSRPTWLTTSSVDIARPAPFAMMPTEPSRPMYCSPFSFARASRGSMSPILEVRPFGVAEGGVVVEGHLGVERVDATVGGEDERVDLDEVGVAFGVAAVQLDEDVELPARAPRVEAGVGRRAQGGGSLEPVEGVDVQTGDRLRLGVGDLLDVDAAAWRTPWRGGAWPPGRG